MSACLFMINPKTIYKLSDKELDTFISNCESDMKNTSNKFYADVASAQSRNILWAKVEKIRRVHNVRTSMEEVNACLAREGYPNTPAMQPVFIYTETYGTGLIKFDGGFHTTVYNPASRKFE